MKKKVKTKKEKKNKKKKLSSVLDVFFSIKLAELYLLLYYIKKDETIHNIF